MRKIIAALMALCLLLGGIPALAEEDPRTALVLEAADAALQDLLAQAEGWQKLLLEHAQIIGTEQDGRIIRVKIEVPRLDSAASVRDHARDGAEAYLTKAFASYFAPGETVTLQLGATVSEKDGQLTLKWGSSSPKNLSGKLKVTAREAWQSYQTNEVKQALDMVLLPKAAKLTGRKPEEVPAMDPLADYAARVAPVLGLTAEQASDRLPCLMMLMDIWRLDFSGGMDASALTFRVRDWKAMLENAYVLALEALPAITGLPEMSALELEKVYCSFLPAACVEAFYQQKGTTTPKIVVDVAGTVTEGPQASGGLMDFFRAYNAEVDRYVAALAKPASQMPYYPPAELIDTALLTGAEAEGGVPVTFDMGSSAGHGYVCVTKKGKPVLSGFIHSGVRLMVRLAPGEYQVYCTTGPEWYGETNLFGRDGFFGSFDLTVAEGDKLIIRMEDKGGNLHVAEMTEADFRRAIGQK